MISAALAGRGSYLFLLWSFVGLCVLVPLSRAASELLLINLGQDAILRLRLELSRRLLGVPLRRLEELGPHRLLTTLTEDISTVSNVVGLVPNLCINGAILAGALAYLAYLSWRVFLIVLALAVLTILAYQLPSTRALAYLRQARLVHDELFSHLGGLVHGIKELKLHLARRRAFLTQTLEATAVDLRNQNIKGMRIYTAASSGGQLLVFVLVGVLIFGLSRSVPLETHVLTGYTLTLLYLMTPLQIVLNAVPTFARAGVALRQVESMGFDLSLGSPEDDATSVARPESTWHQLELVGVTHVYRRPDEDADFVLGPIDLCLRPGELVFIAGGNGSGKTTLAKLITGLYIPESGEVLLDGRTISDGNRDSFRQHFSVVFSDFYLFHDLLGLDRPTLDREAGEFLQELRLAQKVRVEEGKISTLDLSQGQRKRMALLTAYLEDRPIYLLDEWAADQDPFFKEVFYRQLLPSLKRAGKCVVVISHDDRYYDAADVILRLEDGRIVSAR